MDVYFGQHFLKCTIKTPAKALELMNEAVSQLVGVGFEGVIQIVKLGQGLDLKQLMMLKAEVRA